MKASTLATALDPPVAKFVTCARILIAGRLGKAACRRTFPTPDPLIPLAKDGATRVATSRTVCRGGAGGVGRLLGKHTAQPVSLDLSARAAHQSIHSIEKVVLSGLRSFFSVFGEETK